MQLASHVEKIGRMASRRARMDPERDFELWMWMGMTIATHALNAALHHAGLTRSGDYYSYHVIGLYVVPPRGENGWLKQVLPPGDVVHVDAPPIADDLPESIRDASRALKILENMREPYIRGGEAITPQVIETCRGAYAACINGLANTVPVLKLALNGL